MSEHGWITKMLCCSLQVCGRHHWVGRVCRQLQQWRFFLHHQPHRHRQLHNFIPSLWRCDVDATALYFVHLQYLVLPSMWLCIDNACTSKGRSQLYISACEEIEELYSDKVPCVDGSTYYMHITMDTGQLALRCSDYQGTVHTSHMFWCESITLLLVKYVYTQR